MRCFLLRLGRGISPGSGAVAVRDNVLHFKEHGATPHIDGARFAVLCLHLLGGRGSLG